MNPITRTPPLPAPGRSNTIADLAQFDQDLVKALYRYLTDVATRLNQAALVESDTFTPVLQFGGASTGITYSVQSASFKRIGPLVIAEGKITLTSKGSSTGAATIAGFPAASGFASGQLSSYTFASGASPSIIMSGTLARLRRDAGTGSDTPMLDTNFSNTTSLQFSVAYEVV